MMTWLWHTLALCILFCTVSVSRHLTSGTCCCLISSLWELGLNYTSARFDLIDCVIYYRSNNYYYHFRVLFNRICHIVLVTVTDVVLMPDDAVEMETKDESEEPVDLIPTLIPLPPDEVCICSMLQFTTNYVLSILVIVTVITGMQ